jgi:DNA-binding NtrC family response regulator
MFRKFVIDFAERYRTNPVQLDDEARNMLVNYHWRGNVRELKNIAEQISVLSTNKLVKAADLAPYLTDQPKSNLPVLVGQGSGGFVSESTFATERDILYKFIFDLKKDVNEMKRMFVELVNNPAGAKLNANFMNDHAIGEQALAQQEAATPAYAVNIPNLPAGNVPLYIQPATAEASQSFDHHEEVDESLNIADMEKELIIRALKKHRSKRKDASLDLGISERTLYRKLKEYDIEDL